MYNIIDTYIQFKNLFEEKFSDFERDFDNFFIQENTLPGLSQMMATLLLAKENYQKTA